MESKHSHEFVEFYSGMIGYGFDRKTNEDTIIYYLQKFSDDNIMKMMRNRLSDEDLLTIFNLISGLLKRHLTETEYHKFFLKKSI